MPGAQLISSQFDPTLFEPSEFERCAIEPVRGVAKRQSEYLTGRLCAREAIKRLTGIAAVPAVGADRAPQWPAAVCGSISHGAGHAAALVADRRQWAGVGLDIEPPLPSVRAERLAQEILTERELQAISALTTEQRAWRISQTFSLKESLFKALYPLVLRRFYFHDAELIDCASSDFGSASLRLLIELGEQWPAGSEIQAQFCLSDQRLLSVAYIPS